MLKALCAVLTEAMLLFLRLVIYGICPLRRRVFSVVLCGPGRRWIDS